MAINSRFLAYFRPLLDALRYTDKPMRPIEAAAWIRANVDVSTDDVTRTVASGRQTIFINDVHWARYYLVKAGLISKAKRGLWALTEAGRNQQLSDDEIKDLYVQVRDAERAASRGSVASDTESDDEAETDTPAPGSEETDTEEIFWLVGAMWDNGDQMERFLQDGVWKNGYTDRYLDDVRRMRPGERIVIKSAFVQKHALPFDVGDQSVSAMRIKATGTVLKNPGDGRQVQVAWDSRTKPRDWYFYTFRNTIIGLSLDDDRSRRLYDFIFNDKPQDYDWWLKLPYFQEKYGDLTASAASTTTPQAAVEITDEDEESIEAAPRYELDDIIDEGCFLSLSELTDIANRWREKKNLILQGPPGTGKTWLAKRLGFAMIGSNDRETTRTRLRVVQFHPSLSYEDFVRGYRPTAEEKLALQDGVMMEAIDAARSEPDLPYVLVIEEINRGNPAQIFGEMLTLLESSKRHAKEAMELTYRRERGERVYVPENLYVVGTMNVADRSLALVDLALRRRFAFVSLEPAFNDAWRDWCKNKGLGDDLLQIIERRLNDLNQTIANATSLGPQFRIGHSFVTPEETVSDGNAWLKSRVKTEIIPLLEEYWYDAPDTARTESEKLLKGFS